MTVNTLTVGAAVTPVVIHTYISHYLNRRPLREKPTAHISYHEGLELIRRFLRYASFHTVEELQAFTSQWVPVPIWVDVERIEIPSGQLKRSADYIRAQLGPEGIKAVGGPSWWEWRREEDEGLKAEWIEMRKDMEDRKKSSNTKGQRVMLYVHGGAYYFGSVDEHRYQMQRHARKLKARVLAPRYRLSPQFPFPCGLMDCLAAYLYLLEQKHDPSTIILAGDSAGGGMVLSILVTLRDQGIPLPAGAVLISPWVDLTHSFPSLAGDGKMDYIPAHGFLHKPSISWPPPNADDLVALQRDPRGSKKDKNKSPAVSPSRLSREERKEEREAQKEEKAERVRGFSLRSRDQPDLDALSKPPEAGDEERDLWVSQNGKYSIGPLSTLSVQLEDTRIEIKDQIQMYAPNHLLTQPLVSPALQPSLGGLPPLLIQVGGGELLRDEQIYVAHKAAAPLSYLPPPSNNQTAEAINAEAARHKPTNVQLQVWDDLCHVCPTLSFTRPAKHMYRSIAQFGAWALARAQDTSIDILDDDSISFVSADTSASSSAGASHPSPDNVKPSTPRSAQPDNSLQVEPKDEKARVGRAGDSLPPFEQHMIRQRVDRHGRIYPLAQPFEFEALNMPIIEIGVPKPGPVGKWMKAQEQWNSKFAKQKLKIQKQRMKDMKKGYEGFKDETPPPTALAGRQIKGMKKEKMAKKSWGMSLWSIWGSKHDEATLDREVKAENGTDEGPTINQPSDNDPSQRPSRHSFSKNKLLNPPSSRRSRSGSRSRHSTVTYQNQISTSVENLSQLAPPIAGLADATVLAPERSASPLPSLIADAGTSTVPGTPTILLSQDGNIDVEANEDETLIPKSDTFSTRPTRGGIAYPFRLKIEGQDGEVNASTLTLESFGMKTPGLEQEGMESRACGPDPDSNGIVNGEEKKQQSANADAERPGMERFVTAAMGELKTNDSGAKMAERPAAERFETAREDLSGLVGNGNGKG